MSSPVLVVGATGQLGRVIVRKLLAAGRPVRALARSRDKLAALAAEGAEVVAADLLDLPRITDACRGTSDIVATANNNMGSGPTSPTRVDVQAYRNLCAAARSTDAGRLLFVSYRGASANESVDIFRVKWHIEEAIRASGVPYVILRPTAFMDVWVHDVLAPGIRKSGVATVFGDGGGLTNYIAVDDVAEFAVRIVAREEVRNEIVELGGPSDLSLEALVTLIAQWLGASGKRRHLPVAVMRTLIPLIRPFSETTARMISLGHYAATHRTPFPGWRVNAERFGVSPQTVEEYLRSQGGRH